MTKRRLSPVSDVVDVVQTITKLARRVGLRFDLDELKLEAMGYSTEEIDAIFAGANGELSKLEDT